MLLDPGAITALALKCAPAVASETLLAVARTESGFDPLIIGVNGPQPYQVRSPTTEAAVLAADRLLRAGADIDLGLMQINGRNLRALGLPIQAAFDPCRNLAAGAEVLRGGYRQGRKISSDGQAALRIALSYYNTGRPDRGFENGYVARVTNQRQALKPVTPRADAAPASPSWDVFGRLSTAAFVTTVPSTGEHP